MILMMYFHALRISELARLTWAQIDMEERLVHVHRLKGGLPAAHPMPPIEHRYLGEMPKAGERVFLTERGGNIGPSLIRHVVNRAGRSAGFSWQICPTMLRYAYARQMAMAGFDTRLIRHFMGHVKLEATMRFVAPVLLQTPESMPFEFRMNDQARLS